MNFKQYIYLKEQEAINHELEAVKHYNLVRKFQSMVEDNFKKYRNEIEDNPSILEITPKNYPFLDDITIFKGDINAEGASIFDMPNLEHIEGNLDIYGAKKINLPKLKTITGDFQNEKCKEINLPKLESIGDEAGFGADRINFPELKHCYNLNLRDAITVNLPKLKEADGGVYVNPDIIKTIVIPKELQRKVSGLQPTGHNPFIYPEEPIIESIDKDEIYSIRQHSYTLKAKKCLDDIMNMAKLNLASSSYWNEDLPAIKEKIDKLVANLTKALQGVKNTHNIFKYWDDLIRDESTYGFAPFFKEIDKLILSHGEHDIKYNLHLAVTGSFDSKGKIMIYIR